MISGHGSYTAPCILIADGAADSDIQSGRALSGQQEDTLRGFCRANHLNYDEFWVTALIKERINLKDSKKNKDLLTDEYKKVLIDEINQIKPNILVPLSELSFWYLTGLTGIRKFRGSVLPTRSDIPLFSPSIRVLPTLGPNPYLNEDYKLRFITQLDFGKIARNLYVTEPIREIGTCWVAKTASQLRDFIERHYTKSNLLVFDIETFANLPTCISFCFDGSESVCVPILDNSIDLDNRSLLLSLVIKLLKSPIPKCNQNIKFDIRKLERFLRIEIANTAHDTMLAASCLYCEFPKNLGFLTSIYTDMPYFKDEGKEYDPSIHDRSRLYLYNAKDSLATHQICSQQQVELVEQGVGGVYQMLIDILPIYKQMENNGIRIDNERRKYLLAKYNSLFEIYSLKLSHLVGRTVNPLSSVVMQKLVYNKMKIKPVKGVGYNKPHIDKKTGELIPGGPSADEESLEVLVWRGALSVYEKNVLRCIIDCRKLHKVVEILELATYPDGRWRCEFNLAGAETGRTTAGKTTDYYLERVGRRIKLKKYGHSFQTIGKHGFEVDGIEYGKDIRSIFVPSKGYCFVENDLKSAEALACTVLANDFGILPYFDKPGIHKLTGGWVYKCDPSEIKKGILVNGVDRYQIAKMVRHAAERNIKSDGLVTKIYQPEIFCEQILREIHEKQPNIRQVFHREVRQQIQTKRLLVAPNGRRRDFFGRFDESTINEGISFLPQAIVTDYLKQSLKKTFEEVRDYARPLSESHDGFLAEVKLDEKERYAEIYKRNIEVPIDFRTCSLARDFQLVIPCEVEWSDTNWQELRKL